MALRNQLKAEGAFASLGKDELNERDSRSIADVAIAIPSADAGAFLLNHLQRFGEPPATAATYLRHVAKHLPAEGVDQLVTLARARFADDIDAQLAMFKSVQEGMAARGTPLSATAKTWGENLATVLLSPSRDDESEWQNTPIEGMKETKNPWFVQTRECADGAKARFLCSLPPGGEQLTGTLRSKPFVAPAKLTFYLAGHDGPPDAGPQGRNMVRLRSADSNDVLKQAPPPRNDKAQKISWELGEHAGKRVHLEVVDADTGSAYAWLAIGRIEPPAVAIPKHDPSEIAKRHQAGSELVRTLQIKQLQPQLLTLLKRPEPETQAAAAGALAALSNNGELSALASIIAEPNAPQVARDRALATLASASGSDARTALTDVMRVSPRRVQVKLAQALAGSSDGSQALLALVTQRVAPASLLQDQAVKERLIASDSSLRSRIDDLTKGLTPADEKVQKLIDQRRRGFSAKTARVDNGQQLYVKNCAVCHQLGGEGGLVGPQLDGIGGRGVERLSEDVLDPNRSVDHAFRTTLLVLKDDDVSPASFAAKKVKRLCSPTAPEKKCASKRNKWGNGANPTPLSCRRISANCSRPRNSTTLWRTCFQKAGPLNRSRRHRSKLFGSSARFGRDTDAHRLALSLYDNVHRLANLHRVERVSVIVNILNLLAREFDDDIPAFQARLLRRAAPAHTGQFHTGRFRCVVRNRAQIRTQIFATA
jgi:mono/diheme cytochrome c family protein